MFATLDNVMTMTVISLKQNAFIGGELVMHVPVLLDSSWDVPVGHWQTMAWEVVDH